SRVPLRTGALSSLGAVVECVSTGRSPDNDVKPISSAVIALGPSPLEVRVMTRRSPRPAKPCRARVNLETLEDRLAPSVVLGQQPGAPDTPQFHGDAARTGFNQNETFLTPANVASGFGQVWQSPVLDGHLYASPLYQDGVLIQGNGNAANHAGDGVQSASFQ